MVIITSHIVGMLRLKGGRGAPAGPRSPLNTGRLAPRCSFLQTAPSDNGMKRSTPFHAQHHASVVASAGSLEVRFSCACTTRSFCVFHSVWNLQLLQAPSCVPPFICSFGFCVESFSAATRYCDPFCFSGPRPAFSVPVSPSGSTFSPRLQVFSRASQVLQARKSFHLSFFLFRVSIRPRFWTSPSTNPLFHKPSAITSLVADVSIAFCTES